MASTSIAGSGIVLEPLTRENYENWSTLVRNYLIGKDLWDVITVDREIGPTFKSWIMKDARALHIIQLACGSQNLTHIREAESAREAWCKLTTLYRSILWSELKYVDPASSSGRTVLHLAVIAGHGNIVEELVKLGKDKLVKMTDECGYTALHLAAEQSENTDIAKYIISGTTDQQGLLCMATKDGEIPVLLAAAKAHKQLTLYLYGRTPLQVYRVRNFRNGYLLLTRCIAAEMFDVALSLLQRIPELPVALDLAPESLDQQPLYALACLPSASPSGSGFGLLQKIIYKFLILRSKTSERFLENDDDDFVFVDVRIERVLKAHQEEGQLNSSFTGRILGWVLNSALVKVLGRIFLFVHMLVQNIVLSKLPGTREIYDQKRTHHMFLKILECMCLKVRLSNESHLQKASAYDAMLQAAKLGSIEFIDVMCKANPNLLSITDKNQRGVFSHAIMNRRKAIFELIHDAKAAEQKRIYRDGRTDAFGNTLLHLAAYLGPSSTLDLRSGPALQMQKELLWFKAVERIVHPKYKEAKNADGKKPQEIFNESHMELMKAGETWAKETAGHFTLVGTLILTIMFAAAFTLPGGNNQDTGVPMFLHDKLFAVFIVSDIISLFTSSTSVLLFIGILTSSYAENDFLHSLPSKFLFPLLTLFMSVVSMIVAFCASLAMILKGHDQIKIVAISLGCLPIIVLVPSQMRLFLAIFDSSIRST